MITMRIEDQATATSTHRTQTIVAIVAATF